MHTSKGLWAKTVESGTEVKMKDLFDVKRDSVSALTTKLIMPYFSETYNEYILRNIKI